MAKRRRVVLKGRTYWSEPLSLDQWDAIAGLLLGTSKAERSSGRGAVLYHVFPLWRDLSRWRLLWVNHVQRADLAAQLFGDATAAAAYPKGRTAAGDLSDDDISEALNG